jgi:hypothetical protein
MGIFDIDSGADNHLLNEQFHVFSKSPASVATALGDASNRSGHTVTASDVWGQEIPAFFYAKTQAVADSYKSLAKTNDLCRIGNSVAIFENGNWVVKYNSYTDIPDGHKFKNANGDEVIRFHKNRLAYNLNLDNNAADDGLNTTAKIQGWDDVNGKVYDYVATAPKFVTQFVTSTDKIVDGIPSKGFGPFVMAGTTTGDITKVLPEGTSDQNHYIANSFAGIIQFNRARTDAIYVHAFEYCGKTLKSAYSDIVELDEKLSKISVTAAGGVQALSDAAKSAGFEIEAVVADGVTTPTLDIETGSVATGVTKLVTGDAVKTYVDTTALADGGSIAQKIESAINDLGDVAVKGDIKISEIKVKSGSTTTTLTPDSNKSVTVEIPEVQAATTSVAGVVTISDNDAIATTETSTAAATVAAVAATRSAIAGELGALAVTVSSNKTEVDGKISAIEGKLASTGEIGQAIADVKATADSAVQSVTRATGSSTLLTVTDGTDVTISLSTEVATKSDAATAAANAVTTGLATGGNIAQAIAAAKSGAEQTAATALSTARGEITTEISTAVSGLETKLTSGEGSLGGRVTALETATGTTLPAAIEQALEDAKAYSDSLHTTSLDYVVLGDSESLPTASADTLGKIYLVASQNAPTADGAAISGSYVEYMTRKVSETEYTWEKIGTTAADLSAYAKTADLNATNVGSGAVKVSQTNGKVSSVTVATEALVSNNAIKTSVTDANALVKAGDALAAIKLAKPDSYVKSVVVPSGNGGKTTTLTGEVEFKIGTNLRRYDYTRKGFVWHDNELKVINDFAYSNKLAISPNEDSSSRNTMFNGVKSIIAGEVWDATINEVDMSYSKNIAGYIETGNITNGNTLFKHVNTLTTFNSDLSSLKNGNSMFYQTSLSEFVGDMPLLYSATSMFGNIEGKSLKTFIGDISNVYHADSMFENSGLETFIGDLSNVYDAYNMFTGCKLSTDSVECIADTISKRNGTIHIDINSETPNNRENAAFWYMKNNKGWDAYVRGSLYTPTKPSAITTTDENGEVRTTPIPFYAKAVEVEEDRAEYTDANGKFYRVLGGQFIYVNDPETYGMFTCLEDAVANMRLTKYVKPEVEA